MLLFILFILFFAAILELSVCIDGFLKEYLLSFTNTTVNLIDALFRVKNTGSLFTSIINRSIRV